MYFRYVANESTSLGPMFNFPPAGKNGLSQHIFMKGSVPIHTLQAPHTVVSPSVAHKAALRDLYRSKVGQPHVFTSSTFWSRPEQLQPPCLPRRVVNLRPCGLQQTVGVRWWYAAILSWIHTLTYTLIHTLFARLWMCVCSRCTPIFFCFTRIVYCEPRDIVPVRLCERNVCGFD